MQKGTPLHNSNNRHIGISVPTYPGSPISICNTYEDCAPIATTLGWELNDKKIFILDTKTRYPKTAEEVNAPRAFYLMLYKNNKLTGIYKTGEVSSLSEIVEECEQQSEPNFGLRDYEYYTIQDGIVYNCHTNIPMSEDCPKHLPWAVFRELHLEVEMEPVGLGHMLEKIYSIEDSDREIAITTAGIFKRVSGPRYQKLTSEYLHSGNSFHFSWVPAEKLIVCLTAEYCETYHVDRVEEFATTPLTQILAKVVRKLYITVGMSIHSNQQRRTRRHHRSFNKTTPNIANVKKTTASMREARNFGWCLRGTLHWMSKIAIVQKSFAAAGLVLSNYNNWDDVPSEILNHVVSFPRIAAMKMAAVDSYSQRLFCKEEGNTPNYLAIGRAIVKRSNS